MKVDHFIPGMTYRRRDHQNGRFQQACVCGAVLRQHEMDVDFVEKTGICGRCKRTVTLGSITMSDRFKGMEFIGDDYPLAQMIASEPIVGPTVDVEDELQRIAEDE